MSKTYTRIRTRALDDIEEKMNGAFSRTISLRIRARMGTRCDCDERIPKQWSCGLVGTTFLLPMQEFRAIFSL